MTHYLIVSYCVQKVRISKHINSTSKNKNPRKQNKYNLSAHLSLGSGTKQPCVSAGETTIISPPVENQGCLIRMLTFHLQMSRVPTCHSNIKTNTATTSYSTVLMSVSQRLNLAEKPGKSISLRVPCPLCTTTSYSLYHPTPQGVR